MGNVLLFKSYRWLKEEEILKLGWGSPFGLVQNTVTTRPTVGILPPLSNATKTGTVTGGWAQMEPGLLVLDEDCVTALLPASPFRLLILVFCYAEDPGCCSGAEVLQRLLSSYPSLSVPFIVRIIPGAPGRGAMETIQN